MIPALRLTTIAVCLPAAALVAQGRPTPKPERVPTPRMEKPRLYEPRLEKPDYRFEPKWDVDMSDLHFDDFKFEKPMWDHVSPLLDVPKMDMKMDLKWDQFDKFGKFDSKFEHAEMKFHELVEGATFEIGKAKITCARLNHPWVAIAYRVDVDGAAVVYCADTAPFSDMLLGRDFIERPSFGTLPPPIQDELKTMRAGVVALAKNADLLIYDTQFTPEEYKSRPHWGHSRPDDAIEIARDAKVKRLCLFHHAPMRSDDDNDKILATYRELTQAESFELLSAYEGLEIPLGDGE